MCVAEKHRRLCFLILAVLISHPLLIQGKSPHFGVEEMGFHLGSFPEGKAMP